MDKQTQIAIEDGKKLINIQLCINCDLHQYCTHHKEQKYQQFFCLVKDAIEKQYPNIYVAQNYQIEEPTIGSFEIEGGEYLLFSKLRLKKWPKISYILSQVQKLLDKEKENQNPEQDIKEKR